jgi:cytochrome P450
MLTAAETLMRTGTNGKAALPPGPKGRFLVGNLPMLSGDVLGTIERWGRQYGDMFFWRAVGVPVCYLTHPDYVEDVLVTRNQNFIKGVGMRVSPRFFGQGLLTSEGELWRRQRRLMQPAFHRRQIVRYGQVMVECTRKMLADWRAGEIRDFHSEMERLTVEIIARVLFNLDLTDQMGKLEAAALAVRARIARGPAFVYAMRFLPTPTNARYVWTVSRLERALYEIIRERQNSRRSSDDLLSMLLQARDENGEAMSERQVRDELMTVVGAGNDTTTLTLCYAWYLLALHPEAEARLAAELDEVLGNRPPQVEDLPRLTYTDKIIKETLRIYPPVWAFVREALEPFEIGGYCLPARTNFVLSPWILHHDARFFDRPHDFRPERWTEEFERELPKFAYFPFGGGQRTCIGNSFAKMQASLMLATMAQHFRCRLAPGFELELRPTLTLQPKHGISIVVDDRPRKRPSLVNATPTSAIATGQRQLSKTGRCPFTE